MNINPNKSPLDPHRLAAFFFAAVLLLCTILECTDYLIFKWEHSECRKAFEKDGKEAASAHPNVAAEVSSKFVNGVVPDAKKTPVVNNPTELAVEFKLAPH